MSCSAHARAFSLTLNIHPNICFMPEKMLFPARLRRVMGALAAVFLANACLTTPGAAQSDAPGSGGIYSCTDAYGRRITSDRPIPECRDREQRQLTSTGVTRNVLRPPPTAHDRKQKEAKARQEELERLQAEDQRQRDIALSIRYPNLQVHTKARQEALTTSSMRMSLIEKHLLRLQEERADLQKQIDNFPNPEKIPPYLKRKAEIN